MHGYKFIYVHYIYFHVFIFRVLLKYQCMIPIVLVTKLPKDINEKTLQSFDHQKAISAPPLVTLKSKNNPCISSKHFFESPLVHFPNENYKLPNQMTLSTAWWPDAIRSITNPSLENKRRRTLGMIGGLQGFFRACAPRFGLLYDTWKHERWVIGSLTDCEMMEWCFLVGAEKG